jgi:hypothetical protein
MVGEEIWGDILPEQLIKRNERRNKNKFDDRLRNIIGPFILEF